MLLGSMAPFVILILLKTVVDVAIHIVVDLREQPGPAAATAHATI